MAATVDLTALNALDAFSAGKFFVFKKRINFADSGMSLIQNATMSLCDIAAGVILLAAEIKVITAQSDVTDVDLGVHASGATDATLIDGVSMATTGYVFTAGIAAAIPQTAAVELVLTNKDAQTLATAVIEVIVVGVNP